MTARSRPIAEVFRHRAYLIFMLGLGPHATSSWMYRVGVGWLAWELTRSPVWLGVIAAADLIPVIILSPIAGAVTDRIVPVRELRLTQWLQFVQCLALVIALYAGALTIELLFVLTLVLGVVQTFGAAARHATVPYTVPRPLVATAVSLDSALFQASRFIGPAIAALIIPVWGVIGTFSVHLAGTFFFSVMMHFMHVPAPERRHGGRGLVADIVEAVVYVRGHAGIGPLLLMLFVASTCLRPLQDMLPGFAENVFQSDAVGLAWLSSAMGVGAAASATRVALRNHSAGMTSMAFTGMFGIALSTLGFVSTGTLWVGVIFCVLSGYMLNTLSVGVQALVQSAVSDDIRARVMSLYTLIFRGMPALGALTFGALAEWLGLRWSFACAAAICLVAGFFIWPARHAMRAALESERP